MLAEHGSSQPGHMSPHRGLRILEPFLQFLALGHTDKGETATWGLRSRALGTQVTASDHVMSHVHSPVDTATAWHPLCPQNPYAYNPGTLNTSQKIRVLRCGYK